MSGDIAGLLRKLIRGQEETNTRLARIEAAELTAHARRMAAVGALRAAVEPSWLPTSETDERIVDDLMRRKGLGRPSGQSIMVGGIGTATDPPRNREVVLEPAQNDPSGCPHCLAGVLAGRRLHLPGCREAPQAEQDDRPTPEDVRQAWLRYRERGGRDTLTEWRSDPQVWEPVAAEQDDRPPMVRVGDLPAGAQYDHQGERYKVTSNDRVGWVEWERLEPRGGTGTTPSGHRVRPIAADPGPQEGDGREWWFIGTSGTPAMAKRDQMHFAVGYWWLCPVADPGGEA